MPTPAEQKALAFLTFVILAGGAARLLHVGSGGGAPTGEQPALARQMEAVDSAEAHARTKSRQGGSGGVRARKSRDGGARMTRNGKEGAADGEPDTLYRTSPGFPPPAPRVDVDYRQIAAEPVSVPASGKRRGAAPSGTAPPPPAPVDVDVAGVAELVPLPRIGPAAAARIVANRDSFGPFRSLEGLGRVRGMGAATLRQLAGRVTFSGRTASTSARRDYH